MQERISLRKLWSWHHALQALGLMILFFLWPVAVIVFFLVCLFRDWLISWDEEAFWTLGLATVDLILYCLLGGLLWNEMHWALSLTTVLCMLYINSFFCLAFILTDSESPT